MGGSQIAKIVSFLPQKFPVIWYGKHCLELVVIHNRNRMHAQLMLTICMFASKIWAKLKHYFVPNFGRNNTGRYSWG